MWLSRSSQTLALLCSFSLMSSALPFLPHLRQSQPQPLLIPRASYSVVPVDGGAPPATGGGNVEKTATITETITQTAPASPQATLTVYLTNTVPAATETYTSTTTVFGQDTTKTSLITIATPAVTVTVIESEQPSTSYIPTTIIETIASMVTSTIVSPSFSALSSISTSFSTTIATMPSPISSKTYDDGLWHTTYPPWSNSSSSTLLTNPKPTTSLI